MQKLLLGGQQNCLVVGMSVSRTHAFGSAAHEAPVFTVSRALSREIWQEQEHPSKRTKLRIGMVRDADVVLESAKLSKAQAADVSSSLLTDPMGAEVRQYIICTAAGQHE